VVNRRKYFILLQLFDRCSLLIKNPNQDLSNLIDDCERFVLRSFDGIEQSAMHIYHSALSWTPTSSPTRQLYERELMTEAKLVSAVGPTWDACIRIIPVAIGASVEGVVFSPGGALIAAHGECCVKVFDAMTGVNRATFDEGESICSVAFSPDDGFLVSGLLDGTMNVWDVQTGMMFRAFKGSSSALSVAFSSCGTMIASGDDDGTVRIWNILSDSCVYVFQGHSARVTHVCWLATWNQVVSASRDHAIRIWDVGKQRCLKIFAQYSEPVAALASSRGLLLVASKYGTVNIYDSQSGNIIHIIKSNNITHSCLSIDGGKVLVASKNSGYIWDITTKTLTRVQCIDYNGDHATFSPNGTCVASIYGTFLKIWKTNAGYNHREVSTRVHDTTDDVYISDEWRVILISKKMVNILDATTHETLFTSSVANVISIAFSLDSAFVAFVLPRGYVFVLPHGNVCAWNARARLETSIAVGNDVFHIALSPDGSQLVSLSPSHMKLWDLKNKGCIAHLEFDRPLRVHAQISFSTNATNVSVSTDSGTQSWCIFPSHNIDLTRDSIENGDGTKSWLVSHPLIRRTAPSHPLRELYRPLTGLTALYRPSLHLTAQRQQHIYPEYNTNLTGNPITYIKGTKLPKIFVPTTEERSNQDASTPCQSYRCNTDGEWILDQDGRRVLWIPPDERLRSDRSIWNRFKKVVIQTDSGKVYYVNFSQS
jgi:WD40 repeat protein